jgi:hypothetical protein
LTIGFGNIVPVTNAGKILTIFYTFFGIALGFFLLTAYEEDVVQEECESPVIRSSELEDSLPLQAFSTITSVISVETTVQGLKSLLDQLKFPFLILMWYLTCSAMFYWLENNWTFIDSLYFTFITMTAIGFGDFIPYSILLMVGVIHGLFNSVITFY